MIIIVLVLGIVKKDGSNFRYSTTDNQYCTEEIVHMSKEMADGQTVILLISTCTVFQARLIY
jgi:hypothetical protein